MLGKFPESKKFWAFIIAELGWKGLAVLVLFWGKDSIPLQVWAILLAIILVAGFVEVSYISGQVALDKYIKVAKIATEAGRSLDMKGVRIGKDGGDAQENRSPGKDVRG
jgi:hypothetical protein